MEARETKNWCLIVYYYAAKQFKKKIKQSQGSDYELVRAKDKQKIGKKSKFQISETRALYFKVQT